MPGKLNRLEKRLRDKISDLSRDKSEGYCCWLRRSKVSKDKAVQIAEANELLEIIQELKENE